MRHVEDRTLKLHTAPDGMIWFADGENAPCNSSLPLPEIFTHDVWHRERVGVRLLGTHNNAPLMLSLYANRNELKLTRLEIAGPQVCETRKERCDPEIALYRMRQCLLPASLGGWRAMDDVDVIVYRLNQLTRSGDVSAEALALAKTHPVWHAMSFVRTLDPVAFTTLLGTVLDPRWFVTGDSPDKLARFRKFLGLTPHTQQSVTSDEPSRDPATNRCRLVLRCWNNLDPQFVEFDQPENFLWRIAQSNPGWLGELRASQYFAFFLFHAWRDTLVRVNDGLFDDASVFKKPGELKAFRAHMCQK